MPCFAWSTLRDSGLFCHHRDIRKETGRGATPRSGRRLHWSSRPIRRMSEAVDDLTVQNPADMVGETVIDCRPSVLPVSMPLSALSPRTVDNAREISGFRPLQETGPSIMDMDTNEITIDRIVGFQWDGPGTDVEDELPTPASSPVQNVAPVIPPTGTADSLDRGDGFDLDLEKVLLDISVMPVLISPIEESEVLPTSEAAGYAAPATPVVQNVIESPGYASEEGQILSSIQPPPNTFPASAAASVVTLESRDQFLPTMSSSPEDMGPVAASESVRKTDEAETFIVDTAEGSPSTEMCHGDRDSGPDLTQEGPFDVDDVQPEPGQLPLVLNSMPGCQFRMTATAEPIWTRLTESTFMTPV